jgi:prepilin-type processing-associated H-X9-DG protein
MSSDLSQVPASRAAPLGYAPGGERARRWPLVVLPVLATALVVCVAAAVVLPMHNRTHEHPPRQYCASNLRQIGQGVQMYAIEHGGAFPPDFATLLLTEDLTSDVFVCVATEDTRAEGATTRAVAANLTAAAGHVSYVYCGNGLTQQAPANAVVAYEPLSNHRDGMNVLFADGRVQWLDAKQGQKLIAELAAGNNPPRSAQSVGGAGQ